MMTASHALCLDCQSSPSQIEIRKRRLCHDCFRKYVNSKVLKRMESYRFKFQVGNQKKRLFLPLSGGVSSIVLLQILDAQITKQMTQQNRTAYDIVLCNVAVYDSEVEDRERWWTSLQQQFESHTYLPVVPLHDVCQHDERLEEDLKILGITRQAQEEDAAFVTRAISSARSATARSDLRDLLLKRLLVSVAKQQKCESIIWGHSDSKLAAKALAEVAKGRGGSVPNELADGPSPWGLTFNYPLRDLFTAELELYLNVLSPEINGCRFEDVREGIAPVSLRATSIDSLLTTYITSQGEKYPSIMANVVRTASKLQIPSSGEVQPCRICAMPITIPSTEQLMCYGCVRMKQDIKSEDT